MRKFTAEEQARGRTVPILQSMHHRYEARQWFVSGILTGFRVCRNHGERMEVLKAFPFAHGADATREEVTLSEVLAQECAAMANKLMEI